tara:strand:- start:513 stop:737 length:225 start_codon:yes stop_codon:yes gene_type:complete
MDSDKIRGLIDSIVSLLPKNSNEAKEDLKNNIKILLNDYLKKIDVVTREEFDIQKEVLAKTRKKLDELESKLNK